MRLITNSFLAVVVEIGTLTVPGIGFQHAVERLRTSTGKHPERRKERRMRARFRRHRETGRAWEEHRAEFGRSTSSPTPSSRGCRAASLAS
jgi:hypothetical protein